MFDLDAGKLIVIGIVALIVIPAKDLPRVLRQMGQMIGKMRRMAADFQSQLMDAMREAELKDLGEDVKRDLHEAVDNARLDVSFDPMTDVRKQVAGAVETTESTPKLPLLEQTHREPADPAPPRQGAGK